MAKGRDDMKLLQIPRLASVRVDPGKPVVQLRVPSNVVLQLPYEPFEYTSLGYVDARQNPDRSVTVSRNFQAYLDCIKNYQELMAILEATERNVESILKDSGDESSGPQSCWEMEIHVPPEVDPCIQQKIGEKIPLGVTYENKRLVFKAKDFTELASMMRVFFQGASVGSEK